MLFFFRLEGAAAAVAAVLLSTTYLSVVVSAQGTTPAESRPIIVQQLESIATNKDIRHRQLQDQDCQDELALAGQCFGRSPGSDVQGCGNCVTDALGSNLACSELGSVCGIADACFSCGSCSEPFTNFLACRVGCPTITCDVVASDSQVPSPTSAPVQAPQPTITTDLQDCPEDVQIMQACLLQDINSDIDSCGDCFFGAFPDSGLGCEDVTSACTVIDGCTSCGSCGDELLNVVTCSLGCPVDCSAVLTPSPSPAPSAAPIEPTNPPTAAPVAPTNPRSAAPVATPAPVAVPVVPETSAPTDEIKCAEQYSSFNTCLENVADGDTCESCVVGYWPEDISSCQNIDDETCNGISSCPCGSCGDQFLVYVECLSGCFLACDEPSTTQPAVSGPTTPTEPAPSGGDPATSTPTVPVPPPTSPTVPVSTPTEPTSSEGAPTATAAPVPAPTSTGDSSETGDDVCKQVDEDHKECLFQNLSFVQSNDCTACINNVLDGIYEKDNLSCGIIEDDLCGALKSCNCGTCTEPIKDWLDCFVDNSDNLPQGCQVQCTGDDVKPASPTEAPKDLSAGSHQAMSHLRNCLLLVAFSTILYL